VQVLRTPLKKAGINDSWASMALYQALSINPAPGDTKKLIC
jgi:hypothetical protein